VCDSCSNLCFGWKCPGYIQPGPERGPFLKRVGLVVTAFVFRGSKNLHPRQLPRRFGGSTGRCIEIFHGELEPWKPNRLVWLKSFWGQDFNMPHYTPEVATPLKLLTWKITPLEKVRPNELGVGVPIIFQVNHAVQLWGCVYPLWKKGWHEIDTMMGNQLSSDQNLGCSGDLLGDRILPSHMGILIILGILSKTMIPVLPTKILKDPYIKQPV